MGLEVPNTHDPRLIPILPALANLSGKNLRAVLDALDAAIPGFGGGSGQPQLVLLEADDTLNLLAATGTTISLGTPPAPSGDAVRVVPYGVLVSVVTPPDQTPAIDPVVSIGTNNPDYNNWIASLTITDLTNALALRAFKWFQFSSGFFAGPPDYDVAAEVFAAIVTPASGGGISVASARIGLVAALLEGPAPL